MISFVEDIKPVLLLYVIGDTLTTLYALQTGLLYEGNLVLSHIFSVYGYAALVPLKISFTFVLYHVYRNADRYYWNITRYAVSCIGLLATVSNMAVVLHL